MPIELGCRLCGFLLLAALVEGEAISTLEWSWGPVLPLAKTCRATAVVNGVIVTVGGTAWEDVTPAKKVKRWSRAVYALDPRSTEWRALADYPLPAGYAAAAALGTRLFVCGGRSETRANAEVYSIDIATSKPQWQPAPALPHARWGAAAVFIRGILYLAGGIEGNPTGANSGHPVNDVLAFDPAHAAAGWRQIATIPGPPLQWRHVAECGGKLYLFGGLTDAPADADKGLLPHTEAFVLDVANRNWRTLPPLPVPLGSGASTALDSRFVLLAGGYALALPAGVTADRKARTYFTSQCLIFDTVEGRYQSAPPLKMAVTDQGLVYTAGKLFAIGGEDSPYRSRTDMVQIGVFH